MKKNMIETMNIFFRSVGITTVSLLFLFMILILFIMVRDKIEELKYKYKYKHRFDKKPIAKCYCKDCVYKYKYERCKDNYCKENDRYVADDWFCWHATPYIDDQDKEEQHG